jgi:hypothetical protein
LTAENLGSLTAETQCVTRKCFCHLHQAPNNFAWHVTGPDFRDYHLLLDEPAEQVLALALAMTGDIAQGVRKVGGAMVRSIGHVGGLQPAADKDAEYVEPGDMTGGLSQGKRALIPRRIETQGRGKRCGNCEPVGELDRPRGVSNGVPVRDKSDSSSRLDLIQHLSIFALWGYSGFQSRKRQPKPSRSSAAAQPETIPKRGLDFHRAKIRQ